MSMQQNPEEYKPHLIHVYHGIDPDSVTAVHVWIDRLEEHVDVPQGLWLVKKECDIYVMTDAEFRSRYVISDEMNDPELWKKANPSMDEKTI